MFMSLLYCNFCTTLQKTCLPFYFYFYGPWRVVTKDFFKSCACDLSQLDTSADLDR